MPSFTIELRKMMEYYENIGLDRYPIFDETYRVELNKKITDHYAYREIGLETPEMFINRLEVRMNEIMPYFNKLYASERIKIDPFVTIKMKTLGSHTQSQTATQLNTTDMKADALSKSLSANSEFPQQRLMPNGDYATTGSDVRGENTSTTVGEDTGESESKGDGTNESETVGFQGSQLDMLQALRASFLNVDMLVIGELSDLFMLIRDNGNNHTTGWTGLPYSGYYPGNSIGSY